MCWLQRLRPVLIALLTLVTLSACASSVTRRFNGPEDAFLYVNGIGLGSFPRYVSVDFTHLRRVLVQVRQVDHEPLEVWYSEAEFLAIASEGAALTVKRYEK